MAPRRRNIGLDLLSAIDTGIAKGQTAAAIHADLELRPEFVRRVPSARTIRDVVAERIPSPSQRWTFAADDSDEAGAVLLALRTVIEHSEGRVKSISDAEATWIKKLYRADRLMIEQEGLSVRTRLGAWRAYLLARRYAAAAQHPAALSELDAAVAYAPWQDVAEQFQENADRYMAATEKGWIEELVSYGELVAKGTTRDEAGNNPPTPRGSTRRVSSAKGVTRG